MNRRLESLLLYVWFINPALFLDGTVLEKRPQSPRYFLSIMLTLPLTILRQSVSIPFFIESENPYPVSIIWPYNTQSIVISPVNKASTSI